MPIVISRKSGDVLEMSPISQDQRAVLWQQVIKTWLEKHPEEFRTMLEIGGRSNETANAR